MIPAVTVIGIRATSSPPPYSRHKWQDRQRIRGAPIVNVDRNVGIGDLPNLLAAMPLARLPRAWQMSLDNLS